MKKVFLTTLKNVVVLKLAIGVDLKVKEDIEMAKQAKINDVYISIFDGCNYSSWKFRLLNILEYKECQEQALRASNTQDDAEKWKKSDLEAKTIVISTISEKQLEYINTCKTTYETINRFDSIYLTELTAL